jgi:hypothetical protein
MWYSVRGCRCVLFICFPVNKRLAKDRSLSVCLIMIETDLAGLSLSFDLALLRVN